MKYISKEVRTWQPDTDERNIKTRTITRNGTHLFPPPQVLRSKQCRHVPCWLGIGFPGIHPSLGCVGINLATGEDFWGTHWAARVKPISKKSCSFPWSQISLERLLSLALRGGARKPADERYLCISSRSRAGRGRAQPAFPVLRQVCSPGRCGPQKDGLRVAGMPCPPRLKVPIDTCRPGSERERTADAPATRLPSRPPGWSGLRCRMGRVTGGHFWGTHLPSAPSHSVISSLRGRISRNRGSRSREIAEDMLGLTRDA